MRGRRGSRKTRRVVGDPSDARGMAAAMALYLEAMQVRGYSERTIETSRAHLEVFVGWCADRAITRPGEVTRPVLERYQRWVFGGRKADGRPLSFATQFGRLVPLRNLFRWLTRQNRIAFNPASEMELPKIEKRLPRFVLTAEEAEAVLGQADVATVVGLRDRAMLETFYSTGMRRTELARLKVWDVDVARGLVSIRQGKGRKDRVVPGGERALAWIETYRLDARPKLTGPIDEGWLFVSTYGEALDPGYLTSLVAEYVKRAAIGKTGSCHLFRHTCATLMLEGGADIRFIQQMLGHARLETTEVYTQVTIGALKAIHDATHPGARLAKTPHSQDDDGEM